MRCGEVSVLGSNPEKELAPHFASCELPSMPRLGGNDSAAQMMRDWEWCDWVLFPEKLSRLLKERKTSRLPAWYFMDSAV
ncbi:hypothetical protein BaRGS_00026367 [Batillaria attramentaria]|uniref:Uncharacterized protein n=1 Tax=Batillaria attramentaria TaxID=370345 RepID=A0ABD0K651_9CAEN